MSSSVLAAVVSVDPNAPISLAGLFAVVGLLITWILFGFAVWNFRQQLRKRELDEAERFDKNAQRVCEEFDKADETVKRRDVRVNELAATVFDAKMLERIPRMNERVGEIVDLRIDQAFRDRAPSFVDAKVFERAEKAILDQMKVVSSRVDDNTRKLGEMSGQITRDVIAAVAAQLAAFASARSDKVSSSPSGRDD